MRITHSQPNGTYVVVRLTQREARQLASLTVLDVTIPNQIGIEAGQSNIHGLPQQSAQQGARTFLHALKNAFRQADVIPNTCVWWETNPLPTPTNDQPTPSNPRT